jgi:hypothetical protein
VDATVLNLVCVVDPEGTYTVLVVPVFFVTKEEQFETDEEPMWRVKSARVEQP